MESITSLKEFCNSNENKTDEIVPIFSVSGQYELFALYDEIAAIDNDGDKPLIYKYAKSGWCSDRKDYGCNFYKQ